MVRGADKTLNGQSDNKSTQCELTLQLKVFNPTRCRCSGTINDLPFREQWYSNNGDTEVVTPIH